MATSIQIKRSPNVTAPSTVDLLEGELAYSYDRDNNGAGAKLYIEVLDSGSSETIHAIGGKYYTAKVDAATSAATASTLVQRDAFGSLAANNISLSGNISLGGTKVTGGGSGFFVDPIVNNTSGNVVYYNPATKELTYGTAGTASSATALATPRNITLSGDLQGNVYFDGSQDVTIVANVISNSVALGTDTTGIYVANLVQGAGVTLTNLAGEGATPTIALATSGVTATTYGGATNIPVLVVDEYGRITSASNASVSTSFTLAANSGTPDTLSGGDTLRITGSTGINTVVSDNTITITNTGVTSLSGTANEIEVSAANATVQIGLPNDVIIGNNLTVTGDLIVQGTAVTMNTATLTVEDPLVKFGNANPSDSLDIGFFGEYVSSGTKWAGLFRDASDTGKFKLFTDLTSNPTSNVVDTASYTVATLVSNLTGGTVSGLTANIAVADGGTGRGTITTNAVVYGQGTSAVGMATGTAYQVLQLNASGVPVFAGLDGGTY